MNFPLDKSKLAGLQVENAIFAIVLQILVDQQIINPAQASAYFEEYSA